MSLFLKVIKLIGEVILLKLERKYYFRISGAFDKNKTNNFLQFFGAARREEVKEILRLPLNRSI